MRDRALETEDSVTDTYLKILMSLEYYDREEWISSSLHARTALNTIDVCSRNIIIQFTEFYDSITRRLANQAFSEIKHNNFNNAKNLFSSAEEMFKSLKLKFPETKNTSNKNCLMNMLICEVNILYCDWKLSEMHHTNDPISTFLEISQILMLLNTIQSYLSVSEFINEIELQLLKLLAVVEETDVVRAVNIYIPLIEKLEQFERYKKPDILILEFIKFRLLLIKLHLIIYCYTEQDKHFVSDLFINIIDAFKKLDFEKINTILPEAISKIFLLIIQLCVNFKNLLNFPAETATTTQAGSSSMNLNRFFLPPADDKSEKLMNENSSNKKRRL